MERWEASCSSVECSTRSACTQRGGFRPVTILCGSADCRYPLRSLRKKSRVILSKPPTPPDRRRGPAKENPALPAIGAWNWERFKMILATPVHGASLAALRIAVGLVMALEAYSLCRPSAMVQGQTPLERYFSGPDIQFHFPYEGFNWLPLLPAPWIQAVIAVLALAGVSIALGFRYRAAAVTAFLAW